MKTSNKGITSLLVCYLPVVAVQIVSSLITTASDSSWYQNLKKSMWTPPPVVFGVVWTILYAMMAMAVWVVYRTKICSREKKIAYTLFFAQLVANGLWPYIFFGLHNPTLALANLSILFLLIVATATQFFRIHLLAGLLLIPYVMWTAYALYLNAAICWLN